MHYSNVLHPNEWSRYDPSQNSYSPLAQFSSYTLREHNETLDKLRLQLETIARRLSEVSAQESEDHRRYTRMLDALQREESDIVALLTHNKYRIEELERSSATEVVRRREEVQLNHETMKDFHEELSSLNDLENDLLVMKRSIEEKLHATAERRHLFGREFRHGMSILEADHHEAKSVAIVTENLLVGGGASRGPVSPPRASTMTVSPLRGRGATTLSPAPPPRISSPTRSSAGIMSSSRGSPKRSAASYVFGPSNLNNSARPLSPPRNVRSEPLLQPQRSAAPPPTQVPPPPFQSQDDGSQSHNQFRRLSEFGECLHIACRDGKVDDIRMLLRKDQSIASERHPITGDCALHVLCASPAINLEAVKEVCVVDASILQQLNKQGLSPFHIACTNVSDFDHRLKMFLVAQAGVDPNQRTGLGETAAHVCARSDYYSNSLKYVVEKLKVDPTLRVLLSNRQGYSQNMNALDVAKDFQESAVMNQRYLADYFRANNLQ